MARVLGVREFAVGLAREAGRMVSAAFNAPKSATEKGSRADLVTETDTEVEKFLMEGIRARFPDHKFIGEESTADGRTCELTDEPTWIIDPVDGTSNFFKAFPICCISIGYCENKRPVMGVIYNPIKNELYSAEEGKGATLNDVPISVSKFLGVEKCLIITDLGTQREKRIIDGKLANMQRIIHNVLGIRSLGSAAMSIAMVGAGLADAYFEFGIHCWDMAAGVAIVREAGGIVVNFDGSPFDMMSRACFCASSQAVVDAICPLINKIEYPRD